MHGTDCKKIAALMPKMILTDALSTVTGGVEDFKHYVGCVCAFMLMSSVTAHTHKLYEVPSWRMAVNETEDIT